MFNFAVFIVCLSNPHVNNLKSSKSQNVDGWKFEDVTYGPWRELDSNSELGLAVSEAPWFGWNENNDGDDVASISYTFKGNGKANLNYGNCFKQGEVVAVAFRKKYGQETISKAGMFQPHTDIEFEFQDGDELKISELKGAIIQFNNLTLVGCALGMNQFSHKQCG